MRLRQGALIGLACGISSLALRVSAQEIENSDIYVLATELADEVELIREVMGRPYDDSPRLPVSGITLFEVYFHADTLALNSNRLAHELTGAELTLPAPVPTGDVSPADVLPIVERALADIRRVRAELGITEQVEREERGTPIAPTGVFSIILDTNRQLDLLLRDAISPADVSERITFASAYAAGILAAHGGGPPVPEFELEGPARPAFVYRRLLTCMDLVSSIASKSGVDIVTLSSRRNVPDDIEPGHVYTLAQFLVADLVRIAQRLGAEPMKLDPEMPKHVFPSYSFQRAGVLRTQLEQIDSAL